MARPLSPPIAEPLETLRRRLRRETDLRLKTRLHLLVLIQAGDAQTQVEAAERLAVHLNTVWRWLQTYRDGGLKAPTHARPARHPCQAAHAAHSRLRRLEASAG